MSLKNKSVPIFFIVALLGCIHIGKRPVIFSLVSERPILELAGDQYANSWSPDGSYLALMSDASGNWDIWTIRLDGGNPQQLTQEPSQDNAAAWSPDGRQLVFSSDRVNRVWPDLWLINPTDPVAAQRLTPGDGKYFFPAWDPDGRRIAYVFLGTGPLDLELRYFTLSDRVAHLLSTEWIVFSQVAWSPDGRRIAFASARTGNSELWVVTPSDPPVFQQLTHHPAVDSNPTWSPDGRSIVFASTRSGNKDLWVFTLSNPSAVQQLTSHPGSDDHPLWSPDGRSIAFTSDRLGTLDPWLLTVQP